MTYVYPVDVEELVARIRRRGQATLQRLGLSADLRDDIVLSRVARGSSIGWFPLYVNDRAWHGAIDVGLPDGEGDTYWGADVRAVGDGTVLFMDEHQQCEYGFDFGRVIVEHRTPAGEAFFAHYKHVVKVDVGPGDEVRAGQVLGKIGWHGDFPHLSFAVAARTPIGGDDDLVPECAQKKLPRGDGAFNVQRVRVDALDPVEWPIEALEGAPGYVFNPIQMVRYCRGEQYAHDTGTGSSSSCEADPAQARAAPRGGQGSSRRHCPLEIGSAQGERDARRARTRSRFFAPCQRAR